MIRAVVALSLYFVRLLFFLCLSHIGTYIFVGWWFGCYKVGLCERKKNTNSLSSSSHCQRATVSSSTIIITPSFSLTFSVSVKYVVNAGTTVFFLDFSFIYIITCRLRLCPHINQNVIFFSLHVEIVQCKLSRIECVRVLFY